MLFGEKVSTQISFGEVTVESGANVTVNATGYVMLDAGFEVEAGAEFLVQ